MKTSIRYKFVKSLKALGVNFDESKSKELKEMREEINNLPGGILTFTITTNPDGDWIAEANDLPGLITGGFSGDNKNAIIEDAIFTYFGIPAEYCVDKILQPMTETTTTSRSLALAHIGA